MADPLEKQARLLHSIERALDNFRKIGKNNLNAAKIRSRITSLKEKWTQFQEGHDELVSSVSEEEKETIEYLKDNQFYLAEEVYQDTLDFMHDWLEEMEPGVNPNQSVASNNEAASKSSLPLSYFPSIQLPPFDGSVDNWENFRDRFTSLIIENKEMNNFARMHFLRSCVTDRAFDCIGDIQVTANNFRIAWDALRARFENKRRLVKSHLATLLNLNPVSRESATELQALRDKVNIAIASLKNLGREPAELWEDILVFLISQKIDNASRKLWSQQSGSDDNLKSYADMNKFLASRIRALEDNQFAQLSTNNSTTKSTQNRKIAANATAITPSNCSICTGKHYINACPQFLSKSPKLRRDCVKQFKRCFNCLSKSHSARECKSKYTCRLCQNKHHTLLHVASDSAPASETASIPENQSIDPVDAPREANVLVASTAVRVQPHVLLATAWVDVAVDSGRTVCVRALLDQGSQLTFVTEGLVQMLRAKRFRLATEISAIGGVSAGIHRHATMIRISPRKRSTPVFSTSALILRTLTTYTPERIQYESLLSHLSDLPWADPDPTGPEPISLVIGADLYSDMLCEGIRKGNSGQPNAQNTVFGWILSGRLGTEKLKASGKAGKVHGSHVSLKATAHHSIVACTLEQELKRFWEVEDVPRATKLNPMDDRYMSCGCRSRTVLLLTLETRAAAEKVIQGLHRRFIAHPRQGEDYCSFLDEYERLNHMRRVSAAEAANSQVLYIPHHAILRSSNVTTPLRVVFNASSATSNGRSLNDHLLAGPRLQNDLPAVILQWRRFRYVYSADITKMYRQIRVDSRDLDYQRILWSASPSDPPREFQLLTVTYGTASAPFLALQVLKQLTKDESKRFPLTVPVLRDQIYVDDILFGGDEVAEVLKTRDQLRTLLGRGGFELRKWASNSVELLSDLEARDHGLACNKMLQADERVKVLGIGWNPALDAFQFAVSLPDNMPKTKRMILSTIARFFDPLGWATPATITLKIFMQYLWRIKLDWDEVIPAEALERWNKIFSKLSGLNGLSVARWIGHTAQVANIELHGFSDASTAAYAAVVYVRITFDSGSSKITLLAGRSRVAPVAPMSVPRLELLAAVLLARLVDFVRRTLGYQHVPLYCWTDSTVVLAWLRQHSSSWKTFVGNRVAEIQELLPTVSWRHVPTAENPADCASRELYGDEIASRSLWWQGPPWLTLSDDNWPNIALEIADDQLLEKRSATSHLATAGEPWDLPNRYSSWEKLVRVTAYIQRFVRACRRSNDDEGNMPENRWAIAAAEFERAKLFWYRKIQADAFPLELRALSKKTVVSSKSSILSLAPFLDADGVLRVGGRLKHAPIPFPEKHPIIMSSHPLVKLIINHTHIRMLHAGVQLMLATLRREMWIVRARTLIKTEVHKCVRCAREKATAATQLMGSLPDIRVTPSTRSFLHSGLDYAGPVRVRTSGGRGVSARKAYIAVFVCMATRAVHLELVGNYTTAAFLDAFSRFCARRGLPRSIYSDNGTTFVGANRELTSAFRKALNDPNFLNKTASDGVSWHFLPPSAPHFGGLWEAGVRSVKHHLKRVMGNYTLTYEEFSTLLCRIEACLNSRPIAPLNETGDDYEILTPGHFLIGASITVSPEPSLLNINENRLSRWQLVRQLTERFWKQWQSEYVNTLQQRGKWRVQKNSVKVGQMVLMCNPMLPPCKWELARVVQCHPGEDGLVRVVTIRTATAEYKRPIAKLCVLPIDVNLKSN